VRVVCGRDLVGVAGETTFDDEPRCAVRVARSSTVHATNTRRTSNGVLSSNRSIVPDTANEMLCCVTTCVHAHTHTTTNLPDNASIDRDLCMAAASPIGLASSP
jgi:hypothetical protein